MTFIDRTASQEEAFYVLETSIEQISNFSDVAYHMVMVSKTDFDAPKTDEYNFLYIDLNRN